MMKLTGLLILVTLFACNNAGDTQAVNPDTADRNKDPIPAVLPGKDTLPAPATKQYANTRFKQVTVEQLNEGVYSVQGKAQVFEATLSWVVDDGHEELKKGYQTTDAGAPAWGNFKFTVEVDKRRPNSTLTLILFETSANDGSRQHELPIILK